MNLEILDEMFSAIERVVMARIRVNLSCSRLYGVPQL